MGKIRKPDAKEALAYVRAHSPDEATLLEGLLKFTERWLEQVDPALTQTWADTTPVFRHLEMPCLCGVSLNGSR